MKMAYILFIYLFCFILLLSSIWVHCEYLEFGFENNVLFSYLLFAAEKNTWIIVDHQFSLFCHDR